MDREFLKELNKKYGENLFFQYLLRDYLKTGNAEESFMRERQYIVNGCNGFHMKIPTSTPIAFWTEQDILQYIYENKIPIASVYGDVIKTDKYHTTGCSRTGCMFCGFGCHLEKYPNRFQRLAKTHPKQYNYIINTLGMGKVLDYIGVEYRPNITNKGQMLLDFLKSEEE